MLDFPLQLNYNLFIHIIQEVRCMNLTKKITAVFLALAMLFIFASCGEESEEVLDIGTVNIGIIVDGDTAEEGS